MRVLNDYSERGVNARIAEIAAKALADGEIILYPTDTVYALGCDALNAKAIARLCQVKGINPDKQLLSVVCADIAQAAEYARIDNAAFRIIKDNAPGPFTFVLPASTRLPKVFKGRKTVGVRIPDAPLATGIAETLGHPVLTTSCTADDPDDLANPQWLEQRYDNDASLGIDAGEGGTVPSTVVDLTDPYEPVILRQGLGDFHD